MLTEILVSVFLPLVTIFAFATILMKRCVGKAKASDLDKIPGPAKLPIIDHALIWLLNKENMMPKLWAMYGDRCRMKVKSTNFVYLFNPRDIEVLLTSSTNVGKGYVYDFLKPWIGEGLLTSGVTKWQARRKLLSPSLHFKILEDSLDILNEQSKTLVQLLRQDFKNNTERDIREYLQRCTLDIIGEVAMGLKFNSQISKDTSYIDATHKICDIVHYKAKNPIHWIRFLSELTPMGRDFRNALKTVHDFTEEAIRKRKSERNCQTIKMRNSREDEISSNRKQRSIFIDLLLDEQNNPGSNLSDLDIREELDTMLFAGQDTSATTLGWTTFLLACHQDCQVFVHEELDQIFGNDRNRPPHMSDLARMTYLEMCIKEALRLYPSVPYVARVLTDCLNLDDGIKLPSGTNVIMSTTVVHRNEKDFPEPNRFDPNRFLPENVSQRNRFSYIPFSAGPRSCVGQKFAMLEMKVVLSFLFRNFQVETAELFETKNTITHLITRPKDGVKVRLIPR